jgi:hypothetical protein
MPLVLKLKICAKVQLVPLNLIKGNETYIAIVTEAHAQSFVKIC